MKLPLQMLVLALFLVSLAYASDCTDRCSAKYDYWLGIAKGNLANKTYYLGKIETNCWNRPDVADNQSDPCWSMDCRRECVQAENLSGCLSDCNDRFQLCCYESARMNAQQIADECMAQCPNETLETNCTSQCNFYEKRGYNCSCEAETSQGGGIAISSLGGSVYVLKKGSEIREPASPGTQLEVGDSIITGADGQATLSVQNGASLYDAKIGSGQYLKHIYIPIAKAVQYGGSGHALIRGTSNGGGNLIFALPLMAVGLPLLQATNLPEYTAISVREKGGDGDRLETFTRFVDGYASIAPLTADVEYEIRESGFGNKIDVIVKSGKVNVQLPGYEPVTVEAGNKVSVTSSSISSVEKYEDPGACSSAGAFVTLFALIGLAAVFRR